MGCTCTISGPYLRLDARQLLLPTFTVHRLSARCLSVPGSYKYSGNGPASLSRMTPRRITPLLGHSMGPRCVSAREAGMQARGQALTAALFHVSHRGFAQAAGRVGGRKQTPGMPRSAFCGRQRERQGHRRADGVHLDGLGMRALMMLLSPDANCTGTRQLRSCASSAALRVSRDASHLRTVSSAPTVMTSCPSGLHLACTTSPLWPARTAKSRPLSASHTRAVSSELAVTIRRPSGLHAAWVTPAL